MAYCNNAQVASEFKEITFSTSSSVTTADVDRFIEEADSEIDARIGTRFVVPVTGPISLITLRQISIWLVTYRIREILRVKNPSKETEQNVRDGNMRAQALKMLDDIVKGLMTLADASLINSADGVSSYGVSAGLEHTFRKGEDSW